MKRYLISLTAVAVVSAIALLALRAGDTSEAAGPPQVVSAFGVKQIQGQDVIVHVTVVVPPGRDAATVANAALRGLGAQPLGSAAATATGLLWDQFSDDDASNDSVTQNYNPANAPTGAAQALTNSQNTWSNVTTSIFVLADGGTTTRCPSLVDECDGAQFFDGNNDVAWLSLGPNILGVTWWGTQIDEADVALSVNFSWATNGGDFDTETVFLHENGHVAGLGHSPIWKAVMYASYLGVDRDLYRDDINGISALYPASSGGDGGGGNGGVPGYCKKHPEREGCP